MIELPLSLLCMGGYFFAARRWLNIPFRFTPLFIVSFLGLILFLFSMIDILKEGTLWLITIGFSFSAFAIFELFWKKRVDFDKENGLAYQLLILFMGFIVAFYCAKNMAFSVTDDYAYWGVLGKYIYLNDHLPTMGTTMVSRHLSYTPGMGLFHYFFYQLFNRYDPEVSYYAQNIFIVAGLFVVVRKESPPKSLFAFCLLILLMILQSGSIFAKLSVDYLLSLCFFSILWIYFSEENRFIRLISLSPPILFLFLIKQAGLFLGLVLLAVILLDILLFHPKGKREKKRSLFYILCLGLCMVFITLIWNSHCLDQGFGQFAHSINWKSIIAALNIFDASHVRHGAYLFLKSLIIGPADRLKLPYLFWYVLLFCIWRLILKKSKDEEKKRYLPMLSIFIFGFVLYLIMLYFLEIIIFRVGLRSDHTIGMTRYINIYFTGFVLFSIQLYMIKNLIIRDINKKWIYAIVFIAAAVLIGSKSQRLQKEPYEIETEILASRIEKHINMDVSNRIGVIPGENDHELGIRLLYYLMPNYFNYSAFPMKDSNQFVSILKTYDYALVYRPDGKTIKLLNKFTTEKIDHVNFYKIEVDPSASLHDHRTVYLQRLF